jgi:hypothetical protein
MYAYKAQIFYVFHVYIMISGINLWFLWGFMISASVLWFPWVFYDFREQFVKNCAIFRSGHCFFKSAKYFLSADISKESPRFSQHHRACQEWARIFKIVQKFRKRKDEKPWDLFKKRNILEFWRKSTNLEKCTIFTRAVLFSDSILYLCHVHYMIMLPYDF